MDNRPDDADLLARYVATFEKLDILHEFEVPEELRVGTYDRGYWWRPMPFATEPSALQAMYRELGLPGSGSTRFPSLYEALLLSYRWAKVDMGTYRLLANAPAADLSPLAASMRVDEYLRSTLLPNGYIQFGQGPDINYDPVCFDFRHRQKNGDCRIVQLDHEAILCYGRIEGMTELAPNFRSLVLDTIKRAIALLASQRQPSNNTEA